MAPYRWSKAPFSNIAILWDDLWTGLFNLVRYFSLIWCDRDFDHAYLLRLLEFKFRNMADTLESGPTVSGPRHAIQLRICAHLCRRLREDQYLENANGLYGTSKATLDEAAFVRKMDKELLGRLIGKYIDHWWD